jgi:hypothetical protein
MASVCAEEQKERGKGNVVGVTLDMQKLYEFRYKIFFCTKPTNNLTYFTASFILRSSGFVHLRGSTQTTGYNF